ncbi:hypothetical protein PHLCEN_2v10635 [Hermanssonia centrifuga]|uniref:Uncharacterized protein n=1 Tax=Hermanssonia centrifuga TaxID=98765 RepID=A0A2R6NN97_9APHY|nr:hypothetical protein PHLCEN_2v10635 [Hermanssonia centrifuga]
MLVGYTVLALNQTVQKKIDPKAHVNILDPLLQQLRKRVGIAFVKRLTIVLDEESEKGFGLTSGNAALFSPYDLIALAPTTFTSFSLACLTHTLPSPLTAHIISLPLTLPRLPFNLKHTLVRTALKNGAVFELSYVGALGGEFDPGMSVGGSEGGAGAKRNWWAAAREVVRVTKGKGIIVSGGVTNSADLRAPRDVGNLISILGLAQNIAHDASTRTPQSLILRAQTRRTYRAVFSEPKLVIPESQPQVIESEPKAATPTPTADSGKVHTTTEPAEMSMAVNVTESTPATAVEGNPPGPVLMVGKKRGRNDEDGSNEAGELQQGQSENDASKKKKKKKGKFGQPASSEYNFILLAGVSVPPSKICVASDTLPQQYE